MLVFSLNLTIASEKNLPLVHLGSWHSTSLSAIVALNLQMQNVSCNKKANVI